MATPDTAESYIRRIRNPRKRRYAEAYWNSLHAPDADGGETDYRGLSEMAAQAVRLRLTELWESVKQGT